jgi:response regulator of citrate/malate metabolism
VYSDEVWRMIRDMHERRMSIRSIAKEIGISRKSVRKYLGTNL